MKNTIKTSLCASALALTVLVPAQAEDVTVARFFGACSDAGTDTKTSVGEPCIIQSILNATSAADNGVNIETLSIDWGSFYDRLVANYASGNPPDVHVMHRHRVPEFAGLGALADLTDDLAEHGIDIDDWAPAALDAVTYNGRIMGVPMDLHANLWHVNMDLLEAAGLVENGAPILPSSPEELLDHAKRVKEATGQDYLAADFTDMVGIRLLLAFLWQQDSNIFTEDGLATINTPEARRAVETITQLFDADVAQSTRDYSEAQQMFLGGETAILVNGTWVVDFYDSEAQKAEVALDNYYVADFPTLFEQPATWADSHMWAIPASLKASNPAGFDAAMTVLASINDHNIDWARTGHMAVRQSVLESAEYANLPHRTEYANTAYIARDTPASPRYGAIQEVVLTELQSIWLTGVPIETALENAEQDVQDLLDR